MTGSGGPADRGGTSLPRLTQFSSLGSRTPAGDSVGAPPPADASPAADAAGKPPKSPFGNRTRRGPRGQGDTARRDGLRGALGVVGVVGVLSAIAVTLTLTWGGQDENPRHDGGSAVVDTHDYGLDDVTGLGAGAVPSASASGRKHTDGGKDAQKSATPSASASPAAGTSPGASASPGGQPGAPTQDAPSSDKSGPQQVPGTGVFSHASQRCIDVVGGKAVPGAELMIWDCSGSASQHWTFPSDGTMRSLGLCVTLAGGSTADGADLRMASCDGRAAQRIALNSRHDVVSALADKCVDVRDSLTANGTRLQLWSCNGHDNQKWSTS
ncbi:ricin-type beta-trefoil lectin domain protein [Streptomyces tendae]